MSKQVKVADRVFTINETATFKGYTLNQTKGSAKDGQKFAIGRCLNLPAEGEAGAKVPNKAMKDLSVSDASQILDSLITESKNKPPSQHAIEKAYKTLAKMQRF